MKELVNNWNEKHPEYVLVHGMYSYVDNGQSKDMHMLTIFNKDNECICEYKGEDFIKLYNTLEEEWEDALNVLKNLRKYKGVNWSQLLEVGIDNADDLYWWYVTFSIDTTAI